MTRPGSDRILLAHGGGGLLTDELLERVIRPRLANAWLEEADDAAVIPLPPGEAAFTTDSYVVRPLEFPGGDIGRLAVCGTVNDLVVCGAKPAWLSLGLILEEGLPISVLERVLDSAATAAEEAGARIVTGDTKVVPRGQADGLYVNTAGVGGVIASPRPSVDRIRPGDRLLLSGRLAEHGLAVMLAREELSSFRGRLASDVAPLAGLLLPLFGEFPGIRFLRDPTRGGLAGLCAEIAACAGLSMEIHERLIPVDEGARYVAGMLGLDPLVVANEGKALLVVDPEEASGVRDALRAHPLGREAEIIGSVGKEPDGRVDLVTAAGGRRIVTKPYGEELPRIC